MESYGRWSMASFALHVCLMSVLHLFPQPQISVRMYLPAVSSVIARSFLFLAGHTPIHPSLLRSEVTSSILLTLSFTILFHSCSVSWNVCWLPLLPLVAVASLSTATKLCLFFVSVNRISLPIHWECHISAWARFSHINHVYTSPIKGDIWPSGKSRTL